MISPEQVILRLFVAAILGTVVGMERERLDRAAGMRTHALVCLGAALIMLVSAFGFADVLGTANVTLDPSRVAAQVVSGIGFLGAGTIIMRRQVVRGLTTAASVWAVAGIGLAVGGGLYLAAIAATVMALVILIAVKPVETKLFGRRRPIVVGLEIEGENIPLQQIQAAVDRAGLRLEHVLVQPRDQAGRTRVQIVLQRAKRDRLLILLDYLGKVPGAREISSSLNDQPSRRGPSETITLSR